MHALRRVQPSRLCSRPPIWPRVSRSAIKNPCTSRSECRWEVLWPTLLPLRAHALTSELLLSPNTSNAFSRRPTLIRASCMAASGFRGVSLNWLRSVLLGALQSTSKLLLGLGILCTQLSELLRMPKFVWCMVGTLLICPTRRLAGMHERIKQKPDGPRDSDGRLEQEVALGQNGLKPRNGNRV